MEGGQDEWSSEDDPDTEVKKFKLPKRLRGWLFMERSQIPLKEHSGILNMTHGLNIDRLKRVMTESYPDKVLKDIDGRSATKPPWQKSQNKTKKKPFRKKRTSPAKMAEGLGEGEDDDDEDDINALDGDDYDEDDWYDEDADEEYDEEADDGQVAYVDEEGCG